MMDTHTLLFATTNLHKCSEIEPLLPAHFRLISLRDIHWQEEIPEPYDTFEENAKAKTSFLFERTGLTCFSEDSGLEVEALLGRPGVYSARYSGTHGNAEANNNKVLTEMQGMTIRTARFISVISYQPAAATCHLFKGMVEGSVSDRARGAGGFGYDPIFIPAGFHHTFGELPDSIKQAISHRAKALKDFLDYLQTVPY